MSTEPHTYVRVTINRGVPLRGAHECFRTGVMNATQVHELRDNARQGVCALLDRRDAEPKVGGPFYRGEFEIMGPAITDALDAATGQGRR